MRSASSLTAFILYALSTLASAAPAFANHDLTETYRFETSAGGKPVVTYVHLFDESPLENPQLLQQIREGGFDHVAFFSAVEDQDRAPSKISNLDELRDQVATQTDVTVADITVKKSLLKRLGQQLKQSFTNPKLAPDQVDVRYGIVTTVVETGVVSAMYFTDGSVSPIAAAALVGTTLGFSVLNNVWNASVQDVLKKIGSKLGKKGYFSVALIYDYVLTQLSKLVQSPAAWLSASAQMTVLVNSLVSGVGDSKLTTEANGAYTPKSETDVKGKVRYAKINAYLTIFSTVVGSVDLFQLSWMPKWFTVAAYDVGLSTALMMGFYAGGTYLLKNKPETLAKTVEQIDSGLGRVGKWIQARFADCRQILKPDNPANDQVARN